MVWLGVELAVNLPSSKLAESRLIMVYTLRLRCSQLTAEWCHFFFWAGRVCKHHYQGVGLLVLLSFFSSRGGNYRCFFGCLGGSSRSRQGDFGSTQFRWVTKWRYSPQQGADSLLFCRVLLVICLSDCYLYSFSLCMFGWEKLFSAARTCVTEEHKWEAPVFSLRSRYDASHMHRLHQL
ncbi:hypothetical protein VNO80_20672 [Phaseolus coccineus]|uniref:Uncharacterized protein n=1 Tax=Phaseolus coccineus TaxID=3886 RepID=A0AAN9QSC7_PHACN